MRRFSSEAVEEINKDRKEKGKKVIERVEGRQRVEMFSNQCDFFSARAKRARADARDGKYQQLFDFITGNKNRISCVDIEARKRKYEEGVAKPRKPTKSEQCKCGADITPAMNGGIKIGKLLAKYEKEIKAEIEFRGIKYQGEYSKLRHRDKVELLKKNELGKLAGEGKAQEGMTLKNVYYIVPQSPEMKALVPLINKDE